MNMTKEYIDMFNENRYIKFFGNLGSLIGLFLLFKEVLSPLLAKAMGVKLTFNSDVILSCASLAFSIIICTFLSHLLQQNYEQRIKNVLYAIQMQINSSYMPSFGWGTTLDIQNHLSKNQIQYALKKGWIFETNNTLLISPYPLV